MNNKPIDEDFDQDCFEDDDFGIGNRVLPLVRCKVEGNFLKIQNLQVPIISKLFSFKNIKLFEPNEEDVLEAISANTIEPLDNIDPLIILKAFYRDWGRVCSEHNIFNIVKYFNSILSVLSSHFSIMLCAKKLDTCISFEKDIQCQINLVNNNIFYPESYNCYYIPTTDVVINISKFMEELKSIKKDNLSIDSRWDVYFSKEWKSTEVMFNINAIYKDIEAVINKNNNLFENSCCWVKSCLENKNFIIPQIDRSFNYKDLFFYYMAEKNNMNFKKYKKG